MNTKHCQSYDECCVMMCLQCLHNVFTLVILNHFINWRGKVWFSFVQHSIDRTFSVSFLPLNVFYLPTKQDITETSVAWHHAAVAECVSVARHKKRRPWRVHEYCCWLEVTHLSTQHVVTEPEHVHRLSWPHERWFYSEKGSKRSNFYLLLHWYLII